MPTLPDARLVLVYQYGGTSPYDTIIRRVSVHGPQVAPARARYLSAGTPLPPYLADATSSTHTWCELWERDGSPFWARQAIEAIPGPGVHRRPPATQADSVRAYGVACTAAQARAAFAAAAARLGEPYDYPGIVATGLFAVLHVPDLFYGRHWATVYCSELCVVALQEAAIPIWPAVAPDDSNPMSNELWSVQHWLPRLDRSLLLPA